MGMWIWSTWTPARSVMDDGQTADVGPGDAIHIPPGHDAWTVGDEACVVIDFAGLKGYAVGGS
jgi:quercetin dioxygenase-like cupin family protein